MKNNEFRIGNYVQHKGEIVKVEQITKHKIGYHKYADKHTMQYLKYSEIEPIEIPKDIAESILYKDDRLFKVMNIDGSMNIYNEFTQFIKSTRYVHELQNVYFLINNEELEIKF